MKSLYFTIFCCASFAALVEVAKSSYITVTCSGESVTHNMTFESCLADIFSCFRTNCTVKFDSEVYHWQAQEGFRLIENITNLSLEGTNESVIDCLEKGSFGFINVIALSVSNLSFVNCGASITKAMLLQINEAVALPLKLRPDQQIGVFLMNVKDLFFNEVTLNNSLGYGIVGLNLLGNSIIDNSLFINSNVRTSEKFLKFKFDCLNTMNLAKCSGGNAFFIYTDFIYETVKTEASLKIFRTNVSKGANFINGQSQSHTYNPASSQNLDSGGGISLVLLQKQYKVNFEYTNSFSGFNHGFTGANVYINVFSDVANSSILIEKVKIFFGNPPPFEKENYQQNYPRQSASGGGLYYEYGNYFTNDSKHSVQSESNIRYNISFRNIIFWHNAALNGGGIFIKLHLSPTNQHQLKHLLAIDDCSFHSNQAFYGAALYINELQYKQIFNHKRLDDIFSCSITNTLFEQQTTTYRTPQRRVNVGIASTIFLNGIRSHFKFQSVTVANSMDCTGMLLINSAVICDGIMIANNTNHANGGGVILTGQSYFILSPNSVLTIANNSAKGRRGGGIYMPTLAPYNYQPLCFFQVLSRSEVSQNITSIHEYNASIMLINNTADIGYEIYGGDLENCYLMFWDIETKEAYSMFVKTDNSTDNPSKVTSYAETICFCFNEMENCSVQDYSVEAYPGQTFFVSAVPVGQFNGTTATDSIIVNYPGFNKNIEVESIENKHLDKKCSNISYKIQTYFDPQDKNSNSQLFYLLVEGTLEKYYWKSVRVNIKPCPPLFYYSNISNICECVGLIKNTGISCSTHEGSIHKPAFSNIYVGYYNNCTYVYSYCPIDRCNQRANLTAIEHDKNCVNHRQGIMCGECMSGYSRVIGSNKCKKCNNVYLLLILLFAVLGILLVWLLSFFNITVSTGMINGIIFYANMVKVNRDIYYPALSDRNGLTLFVAWINLDFGFEICLFDGMNEFHKTLLQFVFPVYLWVLSLAAIYFTRHSRTVGKILGKHSTSALATVLLLSFTKVLNIVSRIFSPIEIKRQCGHEVQSVLAWWSDPHISFSDTHHIVLMTVAVVFIVFGILPYTLLLVTSPYLHRFNQYKLLRWVARLKPFLDAYEGPYNESSQYWTGFLLLVRVGLMFLFALNIYGYTELQLFVITLASIFIAILTVRGEGIYRSRALNYIETISILNLVVYSIVVQYLITLEIVAGPGLKYDVYASLTSLTILVLQFVLFIIIRIVITILNLCGIVEEKNIKSWILNLLRLKKLKQNIKFVPFSNYRKGRLRYMMDYDSLSDKATSLFNDSGGDSSTDEDLWNKSVNDFREPLLKHLAK